MVFHAAHRDVQQWGYSFRQRDVYDCKNDLFELNNVYGDPAYAAVVDKLKDQLAELRVKYKDSEELDQQFIQKYKERGLIR